MLNARLKEIKNRMVLDLLQENKTLSNELHTLFHGVQNDFHFIEKKITNLFLNGSRKEADNSEVKSVMEFLETHDGYFKIRLIDDTGQEIFKVIQKPNRSVYVSQDLYNLAGQSFYQELNQVKGDEFYFSSMEPSIINGILEKPLRPTIRVSKRIKYRNGKMGLLVFNIDGERVFNLFSESSPSEMRSSEKALIDRGGSYVASSPRLTPERYTMNKVSLGQSSPKLFKRLQKQKLDQGSIELTDNELVVYTNIDLPQTNERWYLISRAPEFLRQKLIFKERLTWIFWEALCLVLVLSWLWRDEKKRHKDEVVRVLLKERGEFIQNVSHQLKTPLAILTNSLESHHPSGPDWREVKNEVHHLTTVVEDMLLLAQVDAMENLPLRNEDILELVGSAVEMAGTKSKMSGVQIRFNVDEKLLHAHHRLEKLVMGELLKSAILNLIDNALDFSPTGGRVDVSVSTDQGRVVIGVKDQGPGVPVEFIPKLFQRFSRGDRARSGSGLGLAITKKIVDLHSGSIELADNTQGAYFEIRL
jgi:signal transduction histidine kinase